MDQKTFDELIKKGEISLILMDGGYDLTAEQLRKVRDEAQKQSKKKIEQMAIELATSPGYRIFMTMPLISSILAQGSGKKDKTAGRLKVGKSEKETKSKSKNVAANKEIGRAHV